ncbi:MAG: hypothetical protein AAGG38_05295 [Planctomycetota bacterium]
MDDHTHQSLDDLADLFLTGTTSPVPGSKPGSNPGSAPGSAPLSPSHPSPGSSTPHPESSPEAVLGIPPQAQTTRAATPGTTSAATPETTPAAGSISRVTPGGGGDPLSGPAPIKLPPKAARHRARAEPPEPTLGDLSDDAPVTHPSADLPETPADPSPYPRLAGQDPPPAFGQSPPPAAAVEAVLLGNLPGMAGPWLTQYAQRLAQKDGTVALLHADDQGFDLELVEPTQPPADARQPAPAPAPASSLRIPPGGFRGRDLVDVLDQLCAARVSPVRTVLVHLDPAPDALPRLLDLEPWTLLSGADDAALVAGYRLLKRLRESDPRVGQAHVGLMVVGSPPDASQNAAQKLRSAVTDLLETPLELLGDQQRMIPARCRTLGRFTGEHADWSRLADWLKALQPLPPRAAPEPAAAPPAAKPALPPLDQPVTLHPEDAPTPRAAAAPSPAPFPPSAEPDTPDPSPAAAAVDLVELIDSDPHAAASIPGGLALEARCPAQPHTQLALDAAGRLHLLHRHDAAQGDPPTPKEAIVELVAVRDWARQHRALLQLTERTRHFDPDADPVLHLFTDRADLSVHLTARLGNLLRLHLLRPVTVGDQHTYFCTPLSA